MKSLYCLAATAVFWSATLEPAEAQSIDALLKRYSTQEWRRDVGEPVIRLGAPGDFDDTHVLSPCVAKIGRRYFLWYVGSQGKVADRVFRLGLAVSDDGREFQKHASGPVLQFSDGKRSILTPTLLAQNNGVPVRDNGKLRMWFAATDFHDPAALHTLHDATSEDGLTWTAPSEPLLRDVYAPSVVHDGDQYRLWYTDVAAKRWCIRHAVSRNGRDWQVDVDPVLEIDQPWETGRLFYPTVRKVDGGYVMWYGAYWKGPSQKTALGTAVSLDGRRWTKSQMNPIFRPDESRAWESHYTTSQSLMQLDDGSWRIWYASRAKPPFIHKYFAIGTAIWPASVEN